MSRDALRDRPAPSPWRAARGIEGRRPPSPLVSWAPRQGRSGPSSREGTSETWPARGHLSETEGRDHRKKGDAREVLPICWGAQSCILPGTTGGGRGPVRVPRALAWRGCAAGASERSCRCGPSRRPSGLRSFRLANELTVDRSPCRCCTTTPGSRGTRCGARAGSRAQTTTLVLRLRSS